MKRIMSGVGLLCVICLNSAIVVVPAVADEAVSVGGRVVSVPNAAGIYWLAFAAMPVLEDAEREAVESAAGDIRQPVSELLKRVVGRYDVSLRELQRARTVVPCDWQLDGEAGPALLMTHLQKARDLSRVALLRSRLRFETGEVAGALADLLAVFKLGRDCAVSPWIVAALVDAAIEERAGEVLALHLPGLSQAQVEDVMSELRRLPAGWSGIEVLEAEGTNFSGWVERWVTAEAARLGAAATGGGLLAAFAQEFDVVLGVEGESAEVKSERALMLQSLTVADVQGALGQMRRDQQELVRLAGLSAAERMQPLQQLTERLESARSLRTKADAMLCFSQMLLPSAIRVIDRLEQVQLRRQLLQEALRVQRHGEAALQPIGGVKVEYRRTAGGFELSFPHAGGVESIVVGRK
ncbi:MAG: hypothetical protein ACK524_22315 [Planctomyces sp.]